MEDLKATLGALTDFEVSGIEHPADKSFVELLRKAFENIVNAVAGEHLSDAASAL